jgi:pimeloyl-ACP methyl ester carboxylesterase
MKDLEIDNYLAEMIVAIDDLGGRVNLVGLCQGGWLSAMIAARFPAKVNALVLAGAPIDTDAGDGPIKRMVHASPASFYNVLRLNDAARAVKQARLCYVAARAQRLRDSAQLLVAMGGGWWADPKSWADCRETAATEGNK